MKYEIKPCESIDLAYRRIAGELNLFGAAFFGHAAAAKDRRKLSYVRKRLLKLGGQEMNTPGTWVYNEGLGAIVVCRGHELKAVADFGRVGLPETAANARLMAASKELLWALEMYLAAHDKAAVNGRLSLLLDQGFDIDMMGCARAAIKKATEAPK